MMDCADRPLLVADIGGTNARFALGARAPDGAISLCAPRGFANDDFAAPEQAVAAYLAGTGARPSLAAFAVAGPVRGGAARLTNRGWRFDEASVRAATGAGAVRLINDFAAAALSTPFLPVSALTALGGPPEWAAADWTKMFAADGARVSVLGPGTGLGHAILIREGGVLRALDTEGGHIDFAAWDDATWAVQRAVTARLGRCAVENLLSGGGLTLLHDLTGGGADVRPAEIVLRDRQGDADARRTVDLFCAILGASAGDLALSSGARGVMLLGGVAQALGARLADSPFRAHFEAKGRFADYMRAIPTALARADHTGLIGAAASICPDAPSITVESAPDGSPAA